jgi:hypothetical protein
MVTAPRVCIACVLPGDFFLVENMLPSCHLAWQQRLQLLLLLLLLPWTCS